MSVPSLDDPSLDWRPMAQWAPLPPRIWRGWLRDTGSLTLRLQRLSAGDFSVEVLAESWVRGRPESLLQLLPAAFHGQRLWSRKVVLKGHGVPWVVAHTLVPQGSLDSPLRQVRTLHNRPLGAFLFRHPQLQRQRVVCAPSPVGWGRCSVFQLFGRPILVAEFFLPELARQPAVART